ncbi:hypothetical protein [Mangrovihabitans endophyticus]|uniref:Uncharacterized protein n=1 Tax=Mangrovihabitans endophyticus TaxID=1751298 RepID=A0A8J3C233_9ACTN|nr:hypothetical protein [Mangrovihabitans endophyticus]GGK98512.1 hypothetical protein GCM10012284_35920 [Mangrovihabitans endophyticus]
MAILHIAVLAAALAGAPCAVVAAKSAHDRRKHARATTLALRHQLHPHAAALRDLELMWDPARAPAVPVAAGSGETVPDLGRLSVGLRRLDRQRCSGTACGSERWLAAVLRAYDHRLQLACHCLGIAEHLDDLVGMDRAIERIRIEGKLESAGLDVRRETPWP